MRKSASNERISDSALLREFAVLNLRFASCTSTKWEQTSVIQIRTVHNDLTWILNPASHLQMKHLGMNRVCNLSVLMFLMTELSCSFWVWLTYFMKLSNLLLHALYSNLLLLVPELFTGHKNKAGPPSLAKYTHFRTNWPHPAENSPLFHNLLSGIWWSSVHGVANCWREETLISSFAQFTVIFQRTFRHDLPYHSFEHWFFQIEYFSFVWSLFVSLPWSSFTFWTTRFWTVPLEDQPLPLFACNPNTHLF